MIIKFEIIELKYVISLKVLKNGQANGKAFANHFTRISSKSFPVVKAKIFSNKEHQLTVLKEYSIVFFVISRF